MPYEVLVDEVTVPKAFDTYKDGDGKVTGYDSKAYTRFKGDVLDDEDVHPTVREAYDNGDDHVTSILKKVSKSAGDKKDGDSNG